MITIKDLKKIIENLPDEMKVGGSGHFGELLECYSINPTKVTINYMKEEILCIVIENAGEEPN